MQDRQSALQPRVEPSRLPTLRARRPDHSHSEAPSRRCNTLQPRHHARAIPRCLYGDQGATWGLVGVSGCQRTRRVLAERGQAWLGATSLVRPCTPPLCTSISVGDAGPAGSLAALSAFSGMSGPPSVRRVALGRRRLWSGAATLRRGGTWVCHYRQPWAARLEKGRWSRTVPQPLK